MLKNPYSCAESPKRAAVCILHIMFDGMGYVEIMATRARSQIEVFSGVDPVSPIGVICRWLQHVRSAFKRDETPAEEKTDRWKE